MEGLLISSVLWSNHGRTLQYLADSFVTKLPQDFDHLEIDPGHGIHMVRVAGISKNAIQQ